MQWCQCLDADYGVDPWIWQSLHGQSFHLSSKLCLCNSFQGCFVPTSKEGHRVHTSVFIWLEFHVFGNCILYLGYPRFWANIHLSVSTYCVCSFVSELPHSGWYFQIPFICLKISWIDYFNRWIVFCCVNVPYIGHACEHRWDHHFCSGGPTWRPQYTVLRSS